MTDLPIASRLIWSISFLVAIAAHAAVVLPWVWREPDDLAGAGGQELDAISFILAEPGVLETRETNLIEPATPAPADAVEEKEGNSEQDQSKEEEFKETQEKPENEVRKPDAIIEEARRPRGPSRKRVPSQAGRAHEGTQPAKGSRGYRRRQVPVPIASTQD
jgi:outer membrane biosynthesis protein TonB